MKFLLRKISFVLLLISFFSLSGQERFNAEVNKISGLKEQAVQLRKTFFSDSLAQDSLLLKMADSLFADYAKRVVRKKTGELVNSGMEKMKNEMMSHLELPAGIPSVNPFEEIDVLAADAGWQGQNAFDHFAGQAEKLNVALTHFDDFKRKGKIPEEFTVRRGSTRSRLRPAELVINTGFVRPLTTGPSLDLYPSFGLRLHGKFVFIAGKTIRVAQSPGSFTGRRIGAEFLLKTGISIFLEGESVQYVTEGISLRNRHVLTGIKKNVSLKGQLSSFLMAGLDWGRQLPDDGYAERYRFRAGIEYKISKKSVQQ